MTFLKEVKTVELIQCLINFGEMFQGRPDCALKRCRHSDVLETFPECKF